MEAAPDEPPSARHLHARFAHSQSKGGSAMAEISNLDDVFMLMLRL